MDDLIFGKPKTVPGVNYSPLFFDDYQKNLNWAKEWIEKNKLKFPKELRIEIKGIERKPTMICFAFSPHKKANCIGSVNSVSLYRSFEAFTQEIGDTYSTFCNLIKKYLYKYGEVIEVWKQEDNLLFESLCK